MTMIETLPPEQDLKALMLAEHERAEPQRLDEGWESCGCDWCQALYRRIDMTKYGNRVVDLSSLIYVKAAPPVKKGNDDEWIHHGLIYCLDGKAWGINTDGQSVVLGKIADAEAYLKSGDSAGLSDGAIEILDRIKEYEVKQYGERAEENRPVNHQRVIGTRGVRARPANHAEYKPVRTRQAKAKQGIPGGKVEPPKPRVFGQLSLGLDETK